MSNTFFFLILPLLFVHTVQNGEPNDEIHEANTEIKDRSLKEKTENAAGSDGNIGVGDATFKTDSGNGGEMKTSDDVADEKPSPNVKGNISPEERYRRLFDTNRVIQLEAVKSIQKFSDYAMKYKLIRTTLELLFKVLTEAKVNLTEKAYMPGDPFPEDEKTREALSKVFENTAMFGDLVLRIPDIVHRIYDKNREWHLVLSWSVWFCNESSIFIGPNAKLLYLMAQEVDLAPKDQNYVNPFKEEDEPEEDATKKSLKKKQKRDKKMKGKIKKPRISKPHTEL